MTNEINAHAAALGVASDATAATTPPAATTHCCGDSLACAGATTDPLVETELVRRKIERAVETLELKSMVQRKLKTRLRDAQWQLDQVATHYDEACQDVERAAEELSELRKVTDSGYEWEGK
jgi:hypothetical protein